jgi:hypothetical protein
MSHHGQIYSFVLNNKRQRVGVLAATLPFDGNDQRIHIGWSRCNKSMGDKFDAKKGIEIAVLRSAKRKGMVFPTSMLEDYLSFVERCKRYFKGAEIA